MYINSANDEANAELYDNYRVPSEIKADERIANLKTAFADVLKHEVEKAETRGYQKGWMECATLIEKARAAGAK